MKTEFKEIEFETGKFLILGSLVRLKKPINIHTTHTTSYHNITYDDVYQIVDINKAFPTKAQTKTNIALNIIKLRNINTNNIVYSNSNEIESLDVGISPHLRVRTCVYKNQETSIRKILSDSKFGGLWIFDKYHK